MQTEYLSNQNTVVSSVLLSEDDKVALSQHVYEIVNGEAFKGCERSIRFLEFIVQKAIAGEFDSLKERLIGIELFGRSPSYSTGEDAIVRVTASNVRKRLLQHYGRYGRVSRFQINLPARTYIPEITLQRSETQRLVGEDRHLSGHSASEIDTTGTNQTSALNGVPVAASGIRQNPQSSRVEIRRLVFYSTLIAILALSLWVLGTHLARTKVSSKDATSNLVLPWSLLLGSSHPMQIITSDRGLVEIEQLAKKRITVSQYADHVYIPDHLSSEVFRLCHAILLSNRASAVDVPIVVAITELAHSRSQKVSVHLAREIQVQDLFEEGNFIFVGSSRSNPWVSLYDDEMDFRFEFDQNSYEFIHNVHPLANEGTLLKIVPSKNGWSYGIIAFLPNPDGQGSALILSGLDVEGTQASGRLIMDLPRMSTILHNCGVGDRGASPYFELLLRAQSVAGSATNTEIVACHRIPTLFGLPH
jgi:hypothetical protein